MILLIKDIKSYFAIDKEDKALRVEKLIELLDTPLATYIDEDIVSLLTNEDAQADGNFIDDIIDNYLDAIENTLEYVLNSLESSNEYIEYLVYDRPKEPTDDWYELIDTSVDIDKITIE
ncbi:hypothetical protein PN290_00200 [Romboutsia sp. 1001216sp1]|uniref:hypothetical protein n=1 Tax=unclassified Romboutsia TaxID=2626894 RepID=UPI0018AC2363|nr:MULTISPECIES: hypothetical protein [unclassified Romboutsia]MDB8794296.1 hypothetical protein [Romboutsia sp. 1001216sp1]MDB8796465.1 hypothetical protein [Romboutsia sp. 1001216sp1]MDB8797782.1 hypothetical protein [Romboutsia sp. 1001216sp1]